MPRLVPAAAARPAEPPNWLNKAELIDEFWPGGRTTVTAVYRLGINSSAITARTAVPAAKANINLRRFVSTIRRSSKFTSCESPCVCVSFICSLFVSECMLTLPSYSFYWYLALSCPGRMDLQFFVDRLSHALRFVQRAPKCDPKPEEQAILK